jgi:hypothetical protein
VSAFVLEMWLSAFMPTFVLQLLETSPYRGAAAEYFNFSVNYLHIYLLTHVQSLLFCAASIGAALNQLGGSPGSHVGPSTPRPSPGLSSP